MRLVSSPIIDRDGSSNGTGTSDCNTAAAFEAEDALDAADAADDDDADDDVCFLTGGAASASVSKSRDDRKSSRANTRCTLAATLAEAKKIVRKNF